MKARVTERRSTLLFTQRRSTLFMTERRSTLLMTYRRSTLFMTERRSTLLMTQRRSTLLIALVWIVAVTLSSPILVYRRQFVRRWLDHTEIWCDDNWPPVYIDRLFSVP